MKKTVLAFAVAAAMGVPAVAAADVTLYGRINMSLDFVDNGTNDSRQLTSNGSRFGIRGSEDLGGGLRGVFQVESSLSTEQGGGTLAGRNSFVGVAGDFGEVRFGNHDTPYKLSTLRLNFLADTVGDMHNIMSGPALGSGAEALLPFGLTTTDKDQLDISSFYTRAKNQLLYISPSFEGFQAMVSYSTGLISNSDRPSSGENDWDSYSLAATFTNGPIFIAGAYEKRNTGLDNTNSQAMKLGGTYTIDDLVLAVQIENIEYKLDGEKFDQDNWHIGARYNIGQAYLMGSYSVAGDFSDDDGAKMYAIGAGYNLSRRTGVYAAYAKVDNDTNGFYGNYGAGNGKQVAPTVDGAGNVQDVTGFTVGLRHNF